LASAIILSESPVCNINLPSNKFVASVVGITVFLTIDVKLLPRMWLAEMDTDSDASMFDTCANNTTVVTPAGVVYTVVDDVVTLAVVVLNEFNGICSAILLTL
jgi:hypothetical protein